MVDEQKEQEEPSVDRLEQLLDCERKRSEDYLTMLRYLQADLDNFKKRFDRETVKIKKDARNLVLQLLDVVDELELAVKNGEVSTSPESLIEGGTMRKSVSSSTL